MFGHWYILCVMCCSVNTRCEQNISWLNELSVCMCILSFFIFSLLSLSPPLLLPLNLAICVCPEGSGDISWNKSGKFEIILWRLVIWKMWICYVCYRCSTCSQPACTGLLDQVVLVPVVKSWFVWSLYPSFWWEAIFLHHCHS